MTKEDKIREAANETYPLTDYRGPVHKTHQILLQQGFEIGATSEAAKDYWKEYFMEFTKWTWSNEVAISEGLKDIDSTPEQLYEQFKNKK